MPHGGPATTGVDFRTGDVLAHGFCSSESIFVAASNDVDLFALPQRSYLCCFGEIARLFEVEEQDGESSSCIKEEERQHKEKRAERQPGNDVLMYLTRPREALGAIGLSVQQVDASTSMSKRERTLSLVMIA